MVVISTPEQINPYPDSGVGGTRLFKMALTSNLLWEAAKKVFSNNVQTIKALPPPPQA